MERLYVAYGSNLNKHQMKYRCPDAKAISTGYLKNWELIFRGSKTGFYATIRRHPGKYVPVVIWSISSLDEKHLDIYEGYPTFYQKQNVYVTLHDNSKIKAMVYIMRKDTRAGIPSERYVQTIYEGYKDFNLDMRFLREFLEYNNREMQKERY